VSIADQLRSTIANSGKSLNSIAKESGVPQPMLYNFSQGKDIRLETAAKIADYFGLKLAGTKKRAKK
jgi:predicted transcriptional regulator